MLLGGEYHPPFAQAQAVRRHAPPTLRSATVNSAPVCVTCLPLMLTVQEVPGTAAGARHTRWLAVAGDRADRQGLAVVKRGLVGLTEPERTDPRETPPGRLARLPDHRELVAVDVLSGAHRRTRCHPGVIADLTRDVPLVGVVAKADLICAGNVALPKMECG